ncbi:MAG: hypothetical protein Q4G03_06580 [Planctomycetia bacterium]|nr:hypothetical protein [Planctomycetia bacterium]
MKSNTQTSPTQRRAQLLSVSLFLLGAITTLQCGCSLFIYDDPYAPPPPQAVYYAPAPPEPIYYEPVPAPGVYYFAPEPVPTPMPGTDVSLFIRGQAPTGENDDFPTLDDFPTIDESATATSNAVTNNDDYPTPPEDSELADFVTQGANIAEPSGVYDPSAKPFRPEPQRESIADREAEEAQLEKNFQTWLLEQKRAKKERAKTPRYLQPIDDSAFDDQNGIYARRAQEQDDEKSFMRRVTADTFAMMQESELSNRELLDWEKDEPTPIDWSKYAITLDLIRAWFGLGPNERAALEYMRQACEKQKEYSKSKDKKDLKEAAVLYEKAVTRWPGPATRSDYARDAQKNPFTTNKGGNLIEEDGLFFAGECWFFYQDYSRALVCYRALVSTYTNTIYKATAMKRLFHIGKYWVDCSEKEAALSVNLTQKDKPTLATFSQAKKAFEAIFLNDATDNGLAPEALFALANAYMRRGVAQGDGAFDDAARYYRELYEFYPASAHAEDACRLAMIALHRSYQGVKYDAAPLEEARRLAETILRSGRGNMDVVYEELESIKEEQAKRLFYTAQYYERRGNYASARSYYNRLAKDFANTSYATQAAQAYGQIEDKPAEADQFSWIRPVVPFLPKSKNQYFEVAPTSNLEELAARDDRLDMIGNATNVADTRAEDADNRR